MDRSAPPAAPTPDDLPPRRTSERDSLSVSLKLVTPVLGGGYRAGQLDDVDIVRVPTIRGHLRFWWRALFAGKHPTGRALYDAESQLWGGVGGGEPRRSQVDVRVEVRSRGEEEAHDIDPRRTDGAYALFPARGEKGGDPRSRRTQTTFLLSITAPTSALVAVRAAVQAWILFGGYGGRTRRGLGAITVTGDDASQWLPRPGALLVRELERLLGDKVFGNPGSARSTPTLAGAALWELGAAQREPGAAWKVAIETLQEFRQGTQAHTPRPASGPSPSAREPAGKIEPSRPSLSNWPEADKLRHLAARALAKGPSDHPPRHNDRPWWPRAGFGLPIVGRFQSKRRGGGLAYREPPDFTLTWRDRRGEVRERMASPLIVKALPLANQTFVPIALWLHRAWPPGEVIVQFKHERDVAQQSAAAFDAPAPSGETIRFAALVGASSLRQAFFDWVAHRPSPKGRVVVPHAEAAGAAR